MHVLYGISYAGSILITFECAAWRAPDYSGSPAGPPIEQLELQKKATPSDRRKNRPLENRATPAHHASGSEKARARAVSSAALRWRYFVPKDRPEGSQVLTRSGCRSGNPGPPPRDFCGVVVVVVVLLSILSFCIYTLRRKGVVKVLPFGPRNVNRPNFYY